MKKLVLALLAMGMMVTTAHAKGTGQIGSGSISVSKDDFYGGYIAGKLAIEGPYYAVQFQVSETGDSVIFRNGNMDAVNADNDCIGKGFELNNNILSVSVTCKSMGNATLNIEINVEGLTKESLSKGATVQVRSEATGGEWFPFNIVKRKKSFF